MGGSRDYLLLHSSNHFMWRREVIFAFMTSIFASYLQIIFMAYLGLHLDFLQTSALIIGFIFGLRNFVQIFFRIPMGEFTQIIGRKPLIVAGVFFYSISFIFMYIATSWVYVLVGTLFIALGMTCYYPSLFAYVGDISKNDYGKINGIVFQGMDIASIFGAYTVKILLERNILDLQEVFLMSLFVGFFGTTLSFIFLPESLEEQYRVVVKSKLSAFRSSFSNSFSSFLSLSRDKRLQNVYRFQFVISFGEFFFQSFFGLFVVISLGFAESDVAGIISIATILLFFLKPHLGSISDKFGFKRPILIALTINSMVLILITQITQLWVVVVAYAVIMTMNLTSYLAVNGATSYSADNNKRGVAMGVLGVWVSIGRSISSFLLGPIWNYFTNRTGDDALGLKITFQFAGIFLFSLTIILMLITKNIDQSIDKPADYKIENVETMIAK